MPDPRRRPAWTGARGRRVASRRGSRPRPRPGPARRSTGTASCRSESCGAAATNGPSARDVHEDAGLAADTLARLRAAGREIAPSLRRRAHQGAGRPRRDRPRPAPDAQAAPPGLPLARRSAALHLPPSAPRDLFAPSARRRSDLATRAPISEHSSPGQGAGLAAIGRAFAITARGTAPQRPAASTGALNARARVPTSSASPVPIRSSRATRHAWRRSSSPSASRIRAMQ